MRQVKDHTDWMRGVLVAERERMGWSLEQTARAVAHKLGRDKLTKQSLDAWERGTVDPKVRQFAAWAEALGFTLEVDLVRSGEDRAVVILPSALAATARALAELSPEDAASVSGIINRLSAR